MGVNVPTTERAARPVALSIDVADFDTRNK